jgi:hypothetical protein
MAPSGEAAFYFILFALTKSTVLASKLSVEPEQLQMLKHFLVSLWCSEIIALVVFGPMRDYVFAWNPLTGALYLILAAHNIFFLSAVWYLLPKVGFLFFFHLF